MERIFFSASNGFALLGQIAFAEYGKAGPTSFWGDTPLTRMFHGVDLTPQMNRITIPSRVLWGAHDPVHPPAQANDALQALGAQDKAVVMFAKSGHSPFDEDPAAFAEAVRPFVQAMVNLPGH